MRLGHDPLGEGFAQRRFNSIHYSVGVAHHFACPESYHTKIVAAKPNGTAHVMSHLRNFAMLVAIHLNHQSRWKADKISKIRSQWKLTAEAQAVKLLLP